MKRLLRFARRGRAGRRGSLTVYLAIVLPLVVVGILTLADLFRYKQNHSKVTKIALAVSDAELSRTNTYMRERYSLLACLDREMTAPALEEYLLRNRVAQDAAVSVSYERLSSPAHFRTSALDASWMLVLDHAIDFARDQIAETETGKAMASVVGSMERLQDRLSGLIELSSDMKWLRAEADMQVFLDRVAGLRRAMADGQQVFVDGMREAKDAAQRLDRDLRDQTASELGEYRRIYDERLVQMQHLIEEGIAMRRALNIQEEELEQLLAEFQIPGKPDEVMAELRTRIEELRASIRAGRDELNSKMLRGLQDGGAESFASFIRQLEAVKSALLKLFAGTQSEGRTLPLDPARDYTKRSAGANRALRLSDLETASHCGDGGAIRMSDRDGASHGGDGVDGLTSAGAAFFEHLRINEWAVGVFQSYDKQCPRKAPRVDTPHRLRAIRGEVEYLITGEVSEASSLGGIKLRLIALRLLPNIAAGALHVDLMREIAAATAPIPPPFHLLAKGALFSAICLAESYSDVELLLQGYGIPLLKGSRDWKISWNALLTSTWTSEKKPPRPSGVLDPKLYYLDHLRILLATQDVDTTLRRAMNLIETDLIERSGATATLDDFSIGHTITLDWTNRGLLRRGPARLVLVNRYHREAP